MPSLKKKFIFSIDVDWIPGSDRSFSRLFDIISMHQLKPTLFFTGKFAIDYADIVRESVKRNYEIGNHGWKHGLDGVENFGSKVSYSDQKEMLIRSTEVIEDISGEKIYIFRAPRMTISDTTFNVLDELNYLIDSSIPARRFTFGLGSKINLEYFLSPVSPYFIKPSILELPPTSLFLPFNMRLVRTVNFASLKKLLQINMKFSDTLVFYLHPTEFVSPEFMKLSSNEPNMVFFKGCSKYNFETLEKFLWLVTGELKYQSVNMREMKDHFVLKEQDHPNG